LVGEMAALAQVFEEHRPRLLAMVRRRMDPAMAARVEAEEILHEAFIRAMGKRPGRDPALPVYTWLYGIARDCLIDAWRAANAVGRSIQHEIPWPEQTSIQLGLGLVGSVTSPSAALDRGELRERIRWAVGQLKPEDQEVLWMRHGDELSFGDVATVLGVTENTATQRYVRALRLFRRHWSEVGPHDSGQDQEKEIHR
jgi:RNA polymerase sigma-70 factor (ECF subfamily)